ncbi:aminotransferase-like domain-containing protein [Nocardiopsis sp. LDBS1602]|uniref:aminotransferase-like domain-containing protein n=1 Tax=Nocardiopsis sp. LDBS1602 TaxID=3109597 RepID=UPI002DB81AEC|nr:PLP-dependent aminotransferase family protein [Nocardiopsis sp. LDBS1602]MEC3893777.1 PLP-dependent aminotransferase family protein [Nocardiopsis sp. LDBS1602]
MLSFDHDSLHAGVVDPEMGSMRVLSETALRFPDSLSFSSGAPYDGNHDLTDLSRHVERYIEHLRAKGLPEERVTRLLFQYGPVNGLIRDEVALMLKQDEDIDVPPEAVMITHGFQEAALVALRGLITSADDVLLSVSPAYVGIRGAARMLDVPVHGILEGPDGLDPEAVAEAARRVRSEGRRAVALYLVPDFSNPSGTVVPLAARRRLLEVAAEEDLVILEDNPYGLFAAEGAALPTLKSLDTDRRVVYLGSFAKSTFPGARLGYLVADQEVIDSEGNTRTLAESLSPAKAMFTVGSSTLSQAVVGGILVENGYDLRSATRELAAIYQERLRAALDALAEHFPDGGDHGVTWNTPSGGFFLVLKVPFIADLAAMERSARDHGVSWAPMSMFHLDDDGGRREIRIGFSNLAPDAIREGIARLAGFIEKTPHDTPEERS